METPGFGGDTRFVPPRLSMLQIAFGPMVQQALGIAAKLGIADRLAAGAKTSADLAASTDTNEPALYRILRALASAGIFTETSARVFENTEMSELMRSDVPGSMRNSVIFMTASWHYNAWSEMGHSVKTGETAWKEKYGNEIFDWFAEHPTEAEVFNNAMTEMSAGSAPAVLEAYDFSEFKTLADIAGGHGYLLSQILKATPGLAGILFDVGSVIAGADQLLQEQGVAERVQKVSGDFFKEVPASDGYIMRHIIHDWDDDRSIAILGCISSAMLPEGKVLIVETIVPEGNAPHFSKLLDLEMLTLPGGKERTEQEYKTLLEQAGFRLNRIIPTNSPFSIVEAVRQ